MDQTHDQLTTYVTSARWFGGKGRRAELRSVTPLPWVVEPGSAEPGVRFEVAEIGYPDDDATAVEYYQLAVSYRPDPVTELEAARIGAFEIDGRRLVGYDALQDPRAGQLILAALLDARQLRGDTGEVTFHATAVQALSPDLEPRIFGGQQSNTSVMYGDVAMIKFFRRLELGRNLDIEVHDALNAAGVADVAGLFGWVEASWPSADDQLLIADLAMVVEKLADAQDGWGLALDSIGQPGDFVEHARSLGVALAETHRALRDAFPGGRQSGAGVATIMKERLARAADVAAELHPHIAGLDQAFDDLGQAELDTQRVHGDFHLGQTLHTPGGWKIIDFEGEPVKSLAERSAPDSVWRDIAGMLRSFDYAAASVPDAASEEWASGCRIAFLQGYTGGRLTAADATVLRAYEADKAIYEVVYEVRNRPDWVGIPLAAVAALANATAVSGRPEHAPVVAPNQVKE